MLLNTKLTTQCGCRLERQLGLSPTDAVGPDDLLRAAKHLGLKVKLSRTSIERLALTLLPALALLRGAEDSMRVAIGPQCDGKRVLFQDFGGSASGKLGSDRNFSAQRSEAPAGSACSRENLGSDPNLLAAPAARATLPAAPATSTGPTIKPIEPVDVFATPGRASASSSPHRRDL